MEQDGDAKRPRPGRHDKCCDTATHIARVPDVALPSRVGVPPLAGFVASS
jgi:hypothetical protein